MAGAVEHDKKHSGRMSAKGRERTSSARRRSRSPKSWSPAVTSVPALSMLLLVVQVGDRWD
eukprot:758714-Hanusia_phi.AAC.4